MQCNATSYTVCPTKTVGLEVCMWGNKICKASKFSQLIIIKTVPLELKYSQTSGFTGSNSIVFLF